MCLPSLRPTVRSPLGHGRLRANRDRGACLPPGDSPAAVPADLHLCRHLHPHRPSPPKLIPKGRYGIAFRSGSKFSWTSISAIGPPNACWPRGDCGFGLGTVTVTDGLQRLEVLLRPTYEALKERNSRGDLHQGDETRLRVFVALEGKKEYAGGCGSCRVWTR